MSRLLLRLGAKSTAIGLAALLLTGCSDAAKYSIVEAGGVTYTFRDVVTENLKISESGIQCEAAGKQFRTTDGLIQWGQKWYGRVEAGGEVVVGPDDNVQVNGEERKPAASP